MTDDLLGRELSTWLRSIDTEPQEPRLSLRRTLANVELTPQARPSRLAAIVARDAIPVEPARHRPVPAATQGGTSRMLVTATAMAVTTALVLAGSVFVTGLVEEPTPPLIGATPEPPATAAPLLVARETVADDRFELTISTPRTTWAADEPIEVETTLTYIGEGPEAVVWGGREIVAFEVMQLDGPIDSGGMRRLPCGRHEVTSRDAETIPFQKSGSFTPDGELGDFWRAWFDDPELRLPAGTYRLVASADYGGRSCSDMVTLEAAVTIEVVDGPLLVARETVADDRFELTISTPRTTWAADEPIEVESTIAYIGAEPEAVVRSLGPDIVAFEVEQLDGPIDSGISRDLTCGLHEFASGDVGTIPFKKSGGYDPEDELGEFWRSWFGEPELRLPAGVYRLIAHADLRPSCTDSAAELHAAVTIEVVGEPANEAEVDWGPLTVISEGGGLDAGMGPGTLVIGDDCVTFTGDGSDVGVTLVWPGEQTSWIPGDRQVIFEHDINGTTRLSDGDRVTFGGDGLGGDSPEVAEQVAAWLESVWVQAPAASCPSALWLVGEVRPVPRVELVNPEGRIRGLPARAREAMEARSDYAGFYIDRQRGRLPVVLVTGDIDAAIEQLRRLTRDDAKLEVREVERSLAELEAIQRTIVDAMAELRRDGVRVVEVGQDVRRNVVFVGVLENVDRASARISDLADASSFRVERVTQPKTPGS